MDRLANYRQIISDYLREQANVPYPTTVNLKSLAIIDSDQFLLLTIGEHKGEQVHSTDVHITIQEDKVLLLVDNTDWDVLAELEARGIAKDDLVDATQTLELVNS